MNKLVCTLMLCISASLYTAEHSHATRAKRKEHPQEETGPQPKKFEAMPASPPLIPTDSPFTLFSAEEYLSLVQSEPTLSQEQEQEIVRNLLLTALVEQNKQLNKRLQTLEAQQKAPLSVKTEHKESAAQSHTDTLEEQINKLKNSVDTHVEIMHAKIAEVDALCVHRHTESQSDTDRLRTRMKAIEEQYRSLVNKTVTKEALTELEKPLELLTRRVNCHKRSIDALKKTGTGETERLKALELSLEKLEKPESATKQTKQETLLKSHTEKLAALERPIENHAEVLREHTKVLNSHADNLIDLAKNLRSIFDSDKVLPMPDLSLPEEPQRPLPELFPLPQDEF